MARITGKNAKILWIDATEGTVDLSTNLRNFTFDHEEEQADATAGADTYRVFIPTVRTISPTAELVMEEKSTGSAALVVSQLGRDGTLLWGPEGTATGKPKWGMHARVSLASEDWPYDNVSIRNLEWVNQADDLLYDGASDTW